MSASVSSSVKFAEPTTIVGPVFATFVAGAGAFVASHALATVVGVLLVDVGLLVEAGEHVGGDLGAHAVDEVLERLAVRGHDLVVDHGRDVVGGLQVLVVLQQDPAVAER